MRFGQRWCNSTRHSAAAGNRRNGKSQLLKVLEADWNARTVNAWKPHPMSGKMTPTEWGKLLQIHVDYHRRQFAA
jgi:hypothetical protein